MSELELFRPATYRINPYGGMRVPGLVIATKDLLEDIDRDKPLEQVCNVAHLPGIVGYSIAMPDIHWGYGFPIGGVAATDAEHGVISPGGVGYDINCGVRLAIVPLEYATLLPKKQKELLHAVFHRVPSGVGKGHQSKRPLTRDDYKEIIRKGAAWSIERGFGLEVDLECTESHGWIKGGALDAISAYAMERGADQLGSIGSGNHFVEIGEISELFDAGIAEKWGVKRGFTYILIHSGSRGFGHQICQDTLDSFFKAGLGKDLPDKQLIAAPIQSELGQTYFQAMAAAANYAFNNRQQILHHIRKAFLEVLSIPPHDICLIYDVCHNIAKFETHPFGGKQMRVCVHRKGATRAFGPGSDELIPLYKLTGQPVIVPGDMGRASHLMAGLGNPLTWSSSCHGAGRARSRIQSSKNWKGRDPLKYMDECCGVAVLANSPRTITEEMPDAYKDVDSVVDAVQEAGLAGKVAKLKPKLVVKG